MRVNAYSRGTVLPVDSGGKLRHDAWLEVTRTIRAVFMLSGAMLAASVSGAVAQEVDQAGLDRAREAPAPYAALPVFTPPAEPFDARACAEGRRTLSIPNTSANPFLKGIIDRMKAAGEQVGLKVVEWENRGQPSQWVQGFESAIREGPVTMNIGESLDWIVCASSDTEQLAGSCDRVPVFARGLPRGDDDHAGPVQPLGRDDCGLFPCHRDHRADHAGHPPVGDKRVQWRRPDPCRHDQPDHPRARGVGHRPIRQKGPRRTRRGLSVVAKTQKSTSNGSVTASVVDFARFSAINRA